jgi:hypothetical protein
MTAEPIVDQDLASAAGLRPVGVEVERPALRLLHRSASASALTMNV